MPTAKVRASTILSEFDQAQTELVGKAVILTDGKAGTVESVWLDEMHGLRISIRGHDGLSQPSNSRKLIEFPPRGRFSIGQRGQRRTHPTSAVLSEAWYFAKRVTLSLALRSSGDAGRGFGRVGAAAALVA